VELLPESGVCYNLLTHVQDLIGLVAGEDAEAVRDPAVVLDVQDVVGVGLHEEVVGPREDDPLVTNAICGEITEALLHQRAVGEQDAGRALVASRLRAVLIPHHTTQELTPYHWAQSLPPLLLVDDWDPVQYLAPISMLRFVPFVDGIVEQR